MTTAKKIRHFYDLYFLMSDVECASYLRSLDFARDLNSLLDHDRAIFDWPEGWNKRSILEAPLFDSLEEIWGNRLSDVYTEELSALAYRSIPAASAVLQDMIAITEIIESHKKE